MRTNRRLDRRKWCVVLCWDNSPRPPFRPSAQIESAQKPHGSFFSSTFSSSLGPQGSTGDEKKWHSKGYEWHREGTGAVERPLSGARWRVCALQYPLNMKTNEIKEEKKKCSVWSILDSRKHSRWKVENDCTSWLLSISLNILSPRKTLSLWDADVPVVRPFSHKCTEVVLVK